MSTFHLFPKLPSEIRLKIWSYCLPPPRTLSIHYSRPLERYIGTSTNTKCLTPGSTSSPYPTLPQSPPHFLSPSPSAQPLLLHTNSESRTAIQKTYTLLILNTKYTSSIYIDFTRDTLLFESLRCSPEGDVALDFRLCPLRERIQKVLFNVLLWDLARVFRDEWMAEVGAMRGLEVLGLVLRTEEGRGKRWALEMGGGDMIVEREREMVEEGIRTWTSFLEGLRREVRNCEFWEGREMPEMKLWTR